MTLPEKYKRALDDLELALGFIARDNSDLINCLHELGSVGVPVVMLERRGLINARGQITRLGKLLLARDAGERDVQEN